ncbi:hypothetical protein Acr_15g0016270 [Actinidia rufa]|uniref:Uncharacterized protein n=1 Tax=Actinidia rufa TaxID=165716 RepID=A0A7J0D7S1_9ERIC|nr:hypothetical protein Acr_00g0000420 [Actinidia rufa]GFS28348.1 hypothetical protein Acr_00g0001280 [Actinidia rufa]GFS28620.1 hypothetical protein Acr_00g0002890 [Actinidia rufa]GFS28624.1 hypothetical protein Acr_00g0002920 [Actinidia rufa]GFY82328.1 hypothetical protein Acr_02g0005680 [Actinidia rufa]
MYTISHYPDIEWWLGRGRPLNPYLRGLMIDYLRSVMKPKDLRLAPDEAFLTSGVKDFPEWSLVRRWVQGWLRYVHWYAGTASSPDVTLKAFFDAPVVQLGQCPKVPILTAGPPSSGAVWLRGGFNGSYLVLVSGLIQPRSRRGLVAFEPASPLKSVDQSMKHFQSKRGIDLNREGELRAHATYSPSPNEEKTGSRGPSQACDSGSSGGGT